MPAVGCTGEIQPDLWPDVQMGVAQSVFICLLYRTGKCIICPSGAASVRGWRGIPR